MTELEGTSTGNLQDRLAILKKMELNMSGLAYISIPANDFRLLIDLCEKELNARELGKILKAWMMENE